MSAGRAKAGVARRESLPARLLTIYSCLYDHFGARRWWPGDSPTEVIIGAILTQSVSWRNVVRAVANLKGAGLLDFAALHAADNETIAALIVPTRYFRQKAKRLKTFAAFLHERYGGKLQRMYELDFMSLRRELLALSGIGPETADCILLYGGDKPIFVVDAYTRRIYGRLGLAPHDAAYDHLQRLFMDNLKPEVALFNDYHAQIVATGHYFCLNQHPRCQECPLLSLCPTGKQEVKDRSRS